MSGSARIPGPGTVRRQAYRWWVHLGLIVTTVVSLVFEPVLTIHILVGLVFVGLVVAHLVQRRRASARLGSRLVRVQTLYGRGGRLALADALLAVMTVAMLASGLWDWLDWHPTRIRWHAITGVVLTALLLVHTMRCRARIRHSRVR
ncbi:hypothetical protein ABH940_006851 [Streptacidiphilus sp. BW17]|uniref:hypothetical protein n=1 Tax=Streptacidiphilus sp. BW17 TaxID=3156274 RepID=UPI0035171E8A